MSIHIPEAICHPGNAQRLAAVRFLGVMMLYAQGEKPSPCHSVLFIPKGGSAECPEFELAFCLDSDAECSDNVTPYTWQQPFPDPPMARNVIIHTAEGSKEVEVKTFKFPQFLSSDGTEDIDFPWPFLTAPHSQGPVAEGISDSWDLAEAMRNAIDQLKPSGSTNLWRYRVVEIKAVRGGFVNVDQLVVKVEDITWSDTNS